jgi:periplasmic protein TonB
MFESSLIESGGKRRNSGRGFAALLSINLELLVVVALILLPLLFTQALPTLTTLTEMPPLPVPRGRSVSNEPRGPDTHTARPEPQPGVIHEPGSVPKRIESGPDAPAPYIEPTGCSNCIGPDTGIGDPNQVFRMFPTTPVYVARADARPEHRARISEGVLEGLLIHKVVPVYPRSALLSRVQGTVKLHAIINKDGRIENLQLTSGHAMLVKAALDAVAQWQYRPYMLNREPVEVETEITVDFKLASN